MPDRVSEATLTLYAEMLDQCLAAEGEGRAGSYVSKQINGATYWYHQQSFGSERKQQTYLGRETPELLETISRRRASRTDEKRRRELVDMLVAGGVHDRRRDACGDAGGPRGQFHFQPPSRVRDASAS